MCRNINNRRSLIYNSINRNHATTLQPAFLKRNIRSVGKNVTLSPHLVKYSVMKTYGEVQLYVYVMPQ